MNGCGWGFCRCCFTEGIEAPAVFWANIHLVDHGPRVFTTITVPACCLCAPVCRGLASQKCLASLRGVQHWAISMSVTSVDHGCFLHLPLFLSSPSFLLMITFTCEICWPSPSFLLMLMLFYALFFLSVFKCCLHRPKPWVLNAVLQTCWWKSLLL